MKKCSVCETKITWWNRELLSRPKLICSGCSRLKSKASRKVHAQEKREETTAMQERIHEIENKRLQAERAEVRHSTTKHALISAVISVVVCSLFFYLSHRDVFGFSPDAQLRSIVDRTTNRLERHLAANGFGLSHHQNGWTANVQNETDFKKRSESPLIATLQFRYASIDDMKPDENGSSSYRTQSCTFVYRYSRHHRRWICTSGGSPVGTPQNRRLESDQRYRFVRNKGTGYWFFYDSKNPDTQPPTG